MNCRRSVRGVYNYNSNTHFERQVGVIITSNDKFTPDEKMSVRQDAPQPSYSLKNVSLQPFEQCAV